MSDQKPEFVFIYPVVTAKVAVTGCNTPEEAVEQAKKKALSFFHDLLRTEGAGPVVYTEFAEDFDDIALVDFSNDPKFLLSCLIRGNDEETNQNPV